MNDEEKTHIIAGINLLKEALNHFDSLSTNQIAGLLGNLCHAAIVTGNSLLEKSNAP
jgi:hypothetical protein